jgi:hypothetical protein
MVVGVDVAPGHAVVGVLGRRPWWALVRQRPRRGQRRDAQLRRGAPVARIRERPAATPSELTPDGEDASVLCMRPDSLRWVAEVLASLGCSFTIVAPAQLRAEVRGVGELLMASAG